MSRSRNPPIDSPSFSSSLLDRVFRSIDGTDEPPCSRVRGGGSATRKSQTRGSASSDVYEINGLSTEKMMNKVGSGASRRNFETEARGAKHGRSATALRTDRSDFMVSNSYDHSEHTPKPPALTGARNLKPIRTSTAASRLGKPEQMQSYVYPDSSRKANEIRRPESSRHASKPEPEAPSPSCSFQNAKCRAAKMYGDLKYVKQPISPGGKLTRFITSLFSKRNSSNKSEKVDHETGAEAIRRRHVPPVATCSSASSYYRSCLRNKSPASSKRSVRFYPVTDDDNYGSQHPWNPRTASSTDSFSQGKMNIKHNQKCGSIKKNYGGQVQSNLGELLKGSNKNEVVNIYDKLRAEEAMHDDGGDGSDGVSSVSSDLFELDHIRGSALGSLNDELPVYETTQFHSKNPALCGRGVVKR